MFEIIKGGIGRNDMRWLKKELKKGKCIPYKKTSYVIDTGWILEVFII